MLKDVDFALAMFNNKSDGSKYHTVKARAERVDILGLDIGGDSFTFDASGYRLEVNGGKAGGQKASIDYSTQPDGKFTVATGTGTSVDFDYETGLLRVAIENVLMVIDEFFYISGGFSFTKQENFTTRISGSTADTSMSVTSFAAGNVDMFVGSGNYFQDTNGDGLIDYTDERDEDAVGLAMENVNFGMVIMKPTNNKNRK